MHIGTGIYEGKEIKDPVGAGPLSARALTIKEEVFTIIGVRVNEATVLDINDTNGMYGLEALSRGSAVCLFINPDKNQASLIAENLRIIGIDPEGLVIGDSIKGFIQNPMIGQYLTEKYDVIFFEIKEKDELSEISAVLEKQKPSGLTVIIYPNHSEYVLPESAEGYRIVETREFDDKKVAIVMKVAL
jgi:16S rRNA G966 N2-methylase RsmD